MSIQSDIKSQIQFLAGAGLIGVEASYYSAVLTGYNTATSARNPSEATTPVTVRGYFGRGEYKDKDGSITTSTTFTIASSEDANLVPMPADRFTATRDGVERSYTVTSVVPLAGGGSFAGYRLVVEG